MADKSREELISDAINGLTEKVSKVLLREFLKLPSDFQLNIVMIKAAQLLLSNVLCHVASNMDELESVIGEQAEDLKELTLNCAAAGFPEKFAIQKH